MPSNPGLTRPGQSGARGSGFTNLRHSSHPPWNISTQQSFNRLGTRIRRSGSGFVNGGPVGGRWRREDGRTDACSAGGKGGDFGLEIFCEGTLRSEILAPILPRAVRSPDTARVSGVRTRPHPRPSMMHLSPQFTRLRPLLQIRQQFPDRRLHFFEARINTHVQRPMQTLTNTQVSGCPQATSAWSRGISISYASPIPCLDSHLAHNRTWTKKKNASGHKCAIFLLSPRQRVTCSATTPSHSRHM